jgi:signal transduction histidine kinase
MELTGYQKLFQMTKLINSKFELPEIIQVLVDAIANEITQADLVGFFIRKPNGLFHGYKGNKLPVDITELIIDPADDAFVRHIIETGCLEYIADTSKDKRADQAKVTLLKIKSLLGIPVFLNDEIFGFVFVHDFGKPMNLTKEQINVTEAFVGMASVAIRNIQIFEQRLHLLETQQLLLDATNALSKSLSVPEVLRTCFGFMQKATAAKDIAIHLYDDKERKLSPFHISSVHVPEEVWRDKHRQEININLDTDRLFYEVITEQKAVAITDVFADPRPNHAACRAFGIRSLLLIPLVAQGSVLGVIAIPEIKASKEYTENEIEFCQSIADISATALSNVIHTENLDHSVKERTAELQQANFKLEEVVKELEQLNELKNDFIAYLSHELRMPITAIKGSVDILARGILGEINLAQHDLLDTTNKAIERLLNQVNELLDFAKLENGKFELNDASASLEDIVADAIEIMEPMIEKKKQKLTVRNNGSVHIHVDRQRILQVLLNLISNANKFTPENGHITIHSYEREHSFYVEVSDNGSGIPVEKQKYIFTKFYQVNNHLKGTGLGLAISKRLIELHGGKMWFESNENQGSMFALMFPKERKRNHAAVEVDCGS